jgi:hypothetical protein
MKNLVLILSTLLMTLSTMANEVIFFYPISYEEQSDLFIKLAEPIEGAFLRLNAQKYYFQNSGVLLENFPQKKSLSFELGQTINGEDYPLLDEAITYAFTPSTTIIIDAVLYKKLTAWSTSLNQTLPLNTYLTALLNEEKIAPEEILSFTQQFYHYKATISTKAAMETNIQAFFNSEKSSGPDEGCNCNFVLNHYSSVSPLKQGAGTYGNGYNFLNNGNTLSEIIPNTTDFDSNSPKWHRWYAREKGPAHDLFLRTYDSGSQFSYEWSTTGLNNTGSLAPSPSYAYNTFQFMCVEQEFDLPNDCGCTKKFCTLYEYNNFLKVIAHRLKPLSNVSSTAEELAIVTLHNNAGVKVIDANRNVAYTECKGNFNFEFLQNIFDLAGAVVNVVIDLQDNTNGPPINNIPDAISDVGAALIDLFKTPPILVTGECEDVYMKTALLRDFECFELKANDPTTLTLQSFTFLGVSGDKKWDNYAIARSDFRLQSIVLTSSVEGTDYCCSDKLGQHLYANMGGPVSETTHNNNVTGAYYLFGPWDNFTPIGYAPIIPMNANRGYFSYNDKNKDCAPIQPKSYQNDLDFLLSASFEEAVTEVMQSNSPAAEDMIEPLASKIAFNLFPNPTHDFLNIELKELQIGSNISLSIYNSHGQLIETVYNGKVEQVSLNMSWSNDEIQDGTYHLVLRENNILIFGKTFVFHK